MSETPAAAEIPAVILRPNKTGTFAAGHPWVLAKSLLPVADVPPDGAVVDVVTPQQRWIARGIYNGRSHLRVRLYSWRRGEALDTAFWHERLRAAVELRHALGYDDPDGAARLVFSEGDGLSGLIVDRYGPYLVVQIAALAMDLRRETLLELLAQTTGVRGIVVRTDRKIAQAEGMEPRDGWAWGQRPEDEVVIREHGVSYRLDLGEGQKTGYYLDQRENRRVAAGYFAGRRVLDMCCYLGGFTLCAAKLGAAREVLGVDASERVVAQARRNAAENGLSNVRFETGEAFETLEDLRQGGQRFGGVILDPPRFAGSKGSIDQALRAYHRLNRLGVELLEPGGILVTCSCSGRVSQDEFRHMLHGVSQKTHREIQVLEQRGAAADHPVRLSCPETEYLKCFICRVL